jgi:predicted dehydrogenase
LTLARGAAIGIGVIGAGYWGPKHVRVFNELPMARVTMVADLDRRRLAAIRQQYRAVRTTTDIDDVLASRDVQAVVVATPPSTHAAIARAALLAGKHVLVEKPIALSSVDAQSVNQLARDRGRVLMVGHTFLFNPAVQKLRQLVLDEELGDVYYVHAQRLNLGLFQRDVNVLWDLAPHDISILMYVLGNDPLAVSSHGAAYVQHGVEDVAHLLLLFPHHVRAELHVSWLDPNKVRRITVVGSRKMVVYDDVEALAKIRVFDRGVDAPPRTDSFGEFQLSYRYGDVTIPHLPVAEPLRLECQHFLDCIRGGSTPLTDGEQGLKVVQVLEAAQASLSDSSALLPVDPTASQHA